MFEINLVPDVKKEMIKAIKVRNWILFVCIIASGAAIAIVAILFGIKGGQDAVLTINDRKIERMANKLDEFDSLDEFLTIQDQLGNLSTIAENQSAASRVFSVLGVILPKNGDTVTLSEMSLDLAENKLTLEGQANAGVEPLIDYRVLESFKKSIAMTTYDYGEYKDKNNNTIPAMCLSETDDNGMPLVEDGNYYATWYKDVKSCDPENPDNGAKNIADRDTSKDEKIYRTPKFDEWYKNGHMQLDGNISGVAHFESNCVTYSGTEVGKSVRWDTKNDVCLLAPDGLVVTESSNGRDENDALVLRFAGDLQINADVFSARKNFLTVIGPSGQNVTDSYAQVEGMFASRASDCEKNDMTCKAENAGEGENK